MTAQIRTQYSPAFPWFFGGNGYVHPDAALNYTRGRLTFAADAAIPMSRYMVKWLAACPKFLAKLPEERSGLLFKVSIIDEELVVNVFRTVEAYNRPNDMQPIYCGDWRLDSVFRFHAERLLDNAQGSKENKFKLVVEHVTRPHTGVFYNKDLPYSTYRMRLNDDQFGIVKSLKDNGVEG